MKEKGLPAPLDHTLKISEFSILHFNPVVNLRRKLLFGLVCNSYRTCSRIKKLEFKRRIEFGFHLLIVKTRNFHPVKLTESKF